MFTFFFPPRRRRPPHGWPPPHQESEYTAGEQAILDRLTQMENQTAMTLAAVKQQIADLKTTVQQNTDKDDALIDLINGYKETVATLTQQLLDAQQAGGTPADIQEVADGLKALSDSMNAQNVKADIALGTNTGPSTGNFDASRGPGPGV